MQKKYLILLRVYQSAVVETYLVLLYKFMTGTDGMEFICSRKRPHETVTGTGPKGLEQAPTGFMLPAGVERPPQG